MSAHGIAGPRGAHARPERRPDPRRTAPPRRPDLRVVEQGERQAARRRRRFRFAVAAGGVFLAAILFGLVGLHVMLAQNQFRLDKLNATAAVEETRYQRLRLQVDQLEAPGRIVATAKNKLHMVVAPDVTYLTPSRPVRPPAIGQATPPSTATQAAGGSGATNWDEVKPQLAEGR